MRVALVADTHGCLDAGVAERIADCHWVVHAGDVGSQAVLGALAERCRRGWIAVRGNNDVPHKWPPAERSFLDDLPLTAELDLPGGVLAVVHGDRLNPASQRHDRLRARYAHARAVVYGHSHRLAVDTTSTPWVLNPGAAGTARTFGGPSCLILTAAKRGWEVEAYRNEVKRVGR